MLTDGHLLFLHGLKQCALDLGWCSVNFVGQNEIRKNWPMLDAKLSFLGVVNFCAHNIGGQHVGGELDAMKLRVHQRSESFQRKRFCKTRNAFEQNMTLDK